METLENCIPVYRVALVKEREENYGLASDEDAAAEIIGKYLADADREQFVVLMLDTKNNIIGINTVAIGTLDMAVVHPREVFKPAILANASRIIIAHNHPSGDLTPSYHDLDTTNNMAKCGEILGIEVLDSIIVSAGRHYSIMEDARKYKEQQGRR